MRRANIQIKPGHVITGLHVREVKPGSVYAIMNTATGKVLKYHKYRTVKDIRSSAGKIHTKGLSCLILPLKNFGDVEIIIEDDDQDCFVFSNALPQDVTFCVFGDNLRIDWKHDPKVYPNGFKK